MAELPASSSRKPPVSGRAQKLSEERLARKRELDRQAQRVARIKTKNHIANLEFRIDALTKVQGTGDIKDLVDQIELRRKENEALKTTLKSIGKLLGNNGENVIVVGSTPEAGNENGHPANSQDNSPESEYSAYYDSKQRKDDQLDIGGPSVSTDLVLSNNGAETCFNAQLFANTYPQGLFPGDMTESEQLFQSEIDHAKFGNVTFSTPSVQPLLDITPFLSGQPGWQASTLDCCCRTIRLSNELLGQCSKLQLEHTSNQRARDADIPIRAILHGWNTVTERYALDPVWQTIRHADAAMFTKCVSPTERLSCIVAICLKLRAQSNPTKENLHALPYFLVDRPSQQFIKHVAIIDYLAWPGLRERCIFKPHDYCSEEFEQLFWSNFRFTWDYQFRDSYICNHQTGLYELSALFLNSFRDLDSWRMTASFLNEFPELKADIQSAPHVEPKFPNFQKAALGGTALSHR